MAGALFIELTENPVVLDRFRIFHTLQLQRKLFSASRTSSCENFSAVSSLHSLSEAMNLASLPLFGLICS